MRPNYLKQNAGIALCLLLSFSLASCGNIKSAWWNSSGERALKNKDYDKAIAKYQKLIERRPDNYENYWNIGVAYAKKGDFKNAAKQVTKLRKLGKKELADELESYIKKHKKGKKRKK